MKSIYLSRTIGGLSTAFGVYWLWGALGSPVQRFITVGREPFDFMFLFGIAPLISIPGVLAVVFGIKLYYRNTSLASLKLVMGVFAFCGALWISSGLSSLCGDFISKKIQPGIFFLVGIFVVVPIYLFVVGQMARMLGMGRLKAADLLERGVLALIAWQLWLVLSAVFMEYCPKDEEYTSVPKEPWGLMALFVPPLISYVAYRVVAARWLPSPPESDQGCGNAPDSISPPLTPNAVPPPPR